MTEHVSPSAHAGAAIAPDSVEARIEQLKATEAMLADLITVPVAEPDATPDHRPRRRRGRRT